jgi:putative transposase
MDYAMQKLRNQRRLWVLNVVDDFNREGLACVLQRRPTSAMLVEALERLIALRGKPKRIRCDNGQQFTARLTKTWARTMKVRLLYIEPGKPAQNAIIERFHYVYRKEVLRHHSFVRLDACQRAASKWLRVYNNERPHGSLGALTPRGYLRSKGFDVPEALS